MKAACVVIGGLYEAKVSGRIAVVRIVSAYERTTLSGHVLTGWHAINTATRRAVDIRSAQRLRRALIPSRESDRVLILGARCRP